MYAIWRERNSKSFFWVKQSRDCIIHNIKRLIRDKGTSLSKAKPLRYNINLAKRCGPLSRIFTEKKEKVGGNWWLCLLFSVGILSHVCSILHSTAVVVELGEGWLSNGVFPYFFLTCVLFYKYNHSKIGTLLDVKNKLHSLLPSFPVLLNIFLVFYVILLRLAHLFSYDWIVGSGNAKCCIV